uniref:Uncharacterized protein n=1 Tax=Micrurus spixii TaxID=129469 RepID=A0A2D4MEY7_9SAUR
MAEPVKCRAEGATRALCYGAGVGLEVAFFNESSSSSTGAKVEVWGSGSWLRLWLWASTSAPVLDFPPFTVTEQSKQNNTDHWGDKQVVELSHPVVISMSGLSF